MERWSDGGIEYGALIELHPASAGLDMLLGRSKPLSRRRDRMNVARQFIAWIVSRKGSVP